MNPRIVICFFAVSVSCLIHLETGAAEPNKGASSRPELGFSIPCKISPIGSQSCATNFAKSWRFPSELDVELQPMVQRESETSRIHDGPRRVSGGAWRDRARLPSSSQNGKAAVSDHDLPARSRAGHAHFHRSGQNGEREVVDSRWPRYRHPGGSPWLGRAGDRAAGFWRTSGRRRHVQQSSLCAIC